MAASHPSVHHPRPDLGDFAWAAELGRERRSVSGPRIVGLVHTRNEESNLPDALESLAWTDGIVVVDMESEDATRDVARAHGARVLSFPACGYVEPARQWALDQVDGDWVMVLDADERVPQGLAEALSAIAASDAADVVMVPLNPWIAGRFLVGSGWQHAGFVRFFRRRMVEWPARIHSRPELRGRVVQLPAEPGLSLIHFNYEDLAHFVAKLNGYTDREAEALGGEPLRDWSWVARHCRQEFAWHWSPQADGTLSVALAMSMLFYRFITQAKRWERAGFPDVRPPDDGPTALRDLAHDGRALHTAALQAAAAGRVHDALELLRRSLGEQIDLETLNDFAVLLIQNGQAAQGRALLEACLAIDAGCSAARENLAALTASSE